VKMIKWCVLLMLLPFVSGAAGTNIGGGQIWPEFTTINVDTLHVWEVLDLLTHTATVWGGTWTGIVSIEADSIMADYFTSTDSLYWYQNNYNLFIRQAATTAGDRDIVLYLVEEDGSGHIMRWDDGRDSWHFVGAVNVNGILSTDNTLAFSDATSTIDPETSGAGTLNLGVSGDADIILLDTSELRSTSTTYTVDDALDNGVYIAILNQPTGNNTFTLPAAASHRNRMVVIKCIHADGSTVDANVSELIDGSETQALAQWDSITLYCTGAAWYII